MRPSSPRRGRISAPPSRCSATSAWPRHGAGMIDVTPDAVPVISPVDAVPGFFIATGFSGHGFGIGPGAGRLAADLVSGDTPSSIQHRSGSPASPTARARSPRRCYEDQGDAVPLDPLAKAEPLQSILLAGAEGRFGFAHAAQSQTGPQPPPKRTGSKGSALGGGSKGAEPPWPSLTARGGSAFMERR